MRTLLTVLLLSLALVAQSARGVLRRPIPDHLVVLSFDDAVRSDFTFVAPLLKKYHFGATFFVCEFPNFADKTKYMTWSQIQQLGQMGFEIGNHTHQHKHVTAVDAAGFADQLAYIEDKLHSLGLPRPVSFAYPAYVSNAMAVGVLARRGYQFARIGGARPYRPTVDNPLLIPSYSTSGDHPERIFAAFQQAKNGQIVVLTIHGVPDVAHPWVTTPPELFQRYLTWLHDHHYRVIAMRDLAKYIDPARALAATSSTTSAGAITPGN
jgi:peptidoglycan/xylan/chitin deacetylase (PgdA/CDA1 family)